MGRHRRSRTSRIHAARRIEAILDAVRGRGSEEFDRRDRERGPRRRYLDLARDGRLFDRLAALDFEYLMSLEFAAGYETLQLLLPQSVLGRAQNGHGFWRDEAGAPLVFRDATFDRVLTALEPLDSRHKAPFVRRERGRRLDELQGAVLSNVGNERMLLEIDGRPFLGIELLCGQEVETRAFLRGLVLAGWMDDLDKRLACMAHHRLTFDGDPLELGGGRTYVVRPDLLAAVGIADPGAGEFAPEDIQRLVDLGVMTRHEREYSRPEFEQVYFRERAGEGICDDLALLWIGARDGWDAYLGAFLMDAVDTYDKFLWRFSPGGFDGRFAAAVQRQWHERFGEDLIRPGEILDVIRFAAKANHPPCLFSSSHRRFIQTEHGSKVSTLLNHWRFLAGDPVFEIDLGYRRFPSREFYDIARNRLEILEITVPETRFTPQAGGR